MDSLRDCEQYFRTHSLEIVEHLLANTWDKAHFESLFGTHVNYIPEKHAIKHQTFADSLIYIQVSLSNERLFITTTEFSFLIFRISPAID